MSAFHAFIVAVLVSPLVITGQMAAQDSTTAPTQFALAGPRFLSVPTRGAPAVDVSTAPTFQRRVTLEFDRIPLRDALDQISRQTGLHFGVSRQLVPVDRVVSMNASHLTVGAALFELLVGLGLDVQMSRDGMTLVLIPRLSRLAQRGSTVSGHVVDAATSAPLDQVAVRIEGPGLGAVTGSDGHYAVGNVPPGTYHITARRVGYTPLTKTITIATDSATRLDFALVPTVAILAEVVTTGAGQQRRVELGNAIAVINADSVTKLAPVTDITDLISGRVPGVQVLASSGLAGDDPAIRIRGRSSITGSNDPIVFVDGVRIDAKPSGIADIFGGSNPTPSRLNDINPAEIESIEILRGPSAATEYGTDAANGVIVIKTKRGQLGPPRWDVGTEQGISNVPATFALQYHSWGHTTGATPTPTTCPVVSVFGPSRYAGTCTLDSVTTWQPLNHSETSIFGDGGRHAYYLQFSDGTPRVRYFLSGDLSDDLGPVRMPPTEQLRVEHELGSPVPYDARYPNADQRANLRQQAAATIGSSTEVSASAGYYATTQRAPDVNNLIVLALGYGPGYRDSLSGYYPFFPPGAVFLNRTLESVSRFVGGVSTTWHRVPWLSLRGTTGADIAGRTDEGLLLPNQAQGLFALFEPGGYRSKASYTTSVYTADGGAVATAQLTSDIMLKTAAGVQYYDTRNRGTALAVTNIGIGNPTLNGGSIFQNTSIQELSYEALTLGTYVDETVSLAERLYLTGAVRLDAGSGFGKQFSSALYPKASVSWVISPESRNLLRLRAAYGQSGVQPQPGAALRLDAPVSSYNGSGFSAGDTVSAYGNARLRPERSSEIETGADIGLFRNRLTLEVTGYVKTTTDALVSVPIEASLGGGSLQENLGKVRNRGLEAGLTGHPIDSPVLAWDFTLSGSVNDNKVVTLGAGVLPIDASFQYYDPYRQTPGYPLYGLWAVPLTYQDLNHDGLIEPNEITVGSTPTFQGSTIPTRELSVNTGLSLFNHRIRLSTQIDHRGGQKLANTAAFLEGNNGQALNSPRGVPLWEQARAVETAINAALFRANSLDIENATFTRWRELSVAYLVPTHLATAARLRSASITLAARNLALWTHYTGPDPEVNAGAGAQFTVAGQQTTAVNHDSVADYGSVPQARYWVLKVSLGL